MYGNIYSRNLPFANEEKQNSQNDDKKWILVCQKMLCKEIEHPCRLFRRNTICESEEQEIIKQKEILRGKRFRDLKMYRNTGRGYFGATYLCRIEDSPCSLFVMKTFCDPDMARELMDRYMQKECLEIPYHPNIVQILSHRSRDVIDFRKLPDYETFWKERCLVNRIRTGIIMMKYHRKSLAIYIDQRKVHLFPFKCLEICYILLGLPKGGHHLHKNRIVHRDIHPGIIFVSEDEGRVWIGDFGCSLDLRDNPMGFKVARDNEIMFSVGSYPYFKKGGNESFLAPEIRDYDAFENEPIDYEFSDIYQIGATTKTLLSTCVKLDHGSYETTRNLEMDHYCKIIEAQLVNEMIRLDPQERISYEDAIRRTEEFIEVLDRNRYEKNDRKEKGEFVKKMILMDGDADVFVLNQVRVLQ